MFRFDLLKQLETTLLAQLKIEKNNIRTAAIETEGEMTGFNGEISLVSLQTKKQA